MRATMIRILALLLGLGLLGACAQKQLDQPLADLGDFRLGHNIVIASKMQKGPVSREATEEEWVTALTSAIGARFGQYQGDRLYHLGVSVEGYMLAPRGLPLVYTPKSALLLNVTVWDDAAAKKLNDRPKQLIVLETTDKDSVVVGSGWGRSRQQQMRGLSVNAAFEIEKWLLRQKEELGWFTGGPIREAPEKAASDPAR